MAVSYSAAGALGYATGNPVAAVPTGIVAGNYLVLLIGSKPGTATATDPAGWTSLGVMVSTTGVATGIDVGPTRIRAYGKVATASEAAVTVVIAGNSASWAQMLRFSNATDLWDVAAATGEDLTGGTAWSATMSSNPGLTAGDLCLVASATPTDVGAGAQFSVESITATGVSAWGATVEVSEPFTSLGQDIGGFVFYKAVTTGTASAAPVVTATASGTTTNVAGPTILVRLREIAAVPVAPSPPVVVGVAEIVQLTTPVFPANTTSFSLYKGGALEASGLPASSTMGIGGATDPTVTYSFTLRAVGPGGTSPDSTAATATPIPSFPANITTWPTGKTSARIHWDVKTYTGVVWILRDGVAIVGKGAQDFYYDDLALVAGTTYVYTVRTDTSTPFAQSSAVSPSHPVTTDPIPTRNPNLVSDLGGPAYTFNRDDMQSDYLKRTVRNPTSPWSGADMTWAGLDFLPQMWLDFFANPVSGVRFYHEGSNMPGAALNYTAGFPYGGCWLTNHHGLGDAIWIIPNMDEIIIIHELAHHINHTTRWILGLQPIVAGMSNGSALALANQVIAKVHAMDIRLGITTYGGTNEDELTAESYRTLVIENADPSFLLVAPSAAVPAGVRADAWFTWICDGDATLAALWRAELTRPEVWPAAPWPVPRTLKTGLAQLNARRNTDYLTGVAIQNLDSNEGPTLLLADRTSGYRKTPPADGNYLPAGGWGRFDRPMNVPVNSNAYIVATTPTAQVSNYYVPDGADLIPAFSLVGGERSSRWRTTICFRVESLTMAKSCLWHAIETIDGLETEYDISWTNATLSASLTSRNGTGGTVTATRTIASAAVLALNERCTVQAVWGEQGAGIVLRHRTTTAGSVTTLTSAAMPLARPGVGKWAMPVPHPAAMATHVAAISVESIHDDGLGPFTWMDAEYS